MLHIWWKASWLPDRMLPVQILECIYQKFMNIFLFSWCSCWQDCWQIESHQHFWTLIIFITQQSVHLYPSGSCRELLGLQLHLVFPDSVLRETAVYTEGRSWNWFHVLEMYTSNPYFIRCYFQMPACTCVWVKDTYNAEVLVQILISPFASSECGTNTEEQSSWNMSCLGFQGQRD